MNTIEKRIDRSVNFGAARIDLPRWNGAVPLVPVSKAEALKSELIKQLASEYSCVDTRLVHQAVNEAHALAALTQVPLLVLPTLAEEKVQNVATWATRQRSLRGGSLAFAA